MKPKLPRLGGLEVFEAAGRLGSFDAAATELHVTPSAVSRQIRTLEEELGVPLFHRLHRGVRVTEEGAVYLAEVQAAFSRIAKATVHLLGDEPEGRLRLSVLASFTGNWLLPRLADFERLHPHIAVELRATTDYADFERDEVDAAIRFGVGPWSGLQSEALLSMRIFAVCSPEVARTLSSPSDLSRIRLLHESHVPGAWENYLRAAAVDGVSTVEGRTLDNAQLLLEAAMAGQGVALSTQLLVQRLLDEGKLVRPFDLSVETPLSYHLVYRPGDLGRRPLKAFRDWLVATMRGFSGQ